MPEISAGWSEKPLRLLLVVLRAFFFLHSVIVVNVLHGRQDNQTGYDDGNDGDGHNCNEHFPLRMLPFCRSIAHPAAFASPFRLRFRIRLQKEKPCWGAGLPVGPKYPNKVMPQSWRAWLTWHRPSGDPLSLRLIYLAIPKIGIFYTYFNF